MQCGTIEGATRRFGGENYHTIEVRDVVEPVGDNPNVPAMQTAWYPSPDDMAALAAGKPIILTILGNVHPPVRLEVDTE